MFLAKAQRLSKFLQELESISRGIAVRAAERLGPVGPQLAARTPQCGVQPQRDAVGLGCDAPQNRRMARLRRLTAIASAQK